MVDNQSQIVEKILTEQVCIVSRDQQRELASKPNTKVGAGAIATDLVPKLTSPKDLCADLSTTHTDCLFQEKPGQLMCSVFRIGVEVCLDPSPQLIPPPPHSALRIP